MYLENINAVKIAVYAIAQAISGHWFLKPIADCPQGVWLTWVNFDPMSGDTQHSWQKNILGLQLPTDPRWVNLAGMSLAEILTDHAYCEQKAAASCMSLIQIYSDKDALVNELSPIVTEEWGHFRMVLAELRKRALPLGRQRKDEYVHALMAFETRGGRAEDRLLDKLLMCALIEARSCERFKRLSEGLDDEYLQQFYRRFMESEAGHYRTFIDLARTYLPEEKVWARWQQWLDYEAGVMAELEIRGDRMH
jgi:tRNA-(ms[2]io[6]A)-hydroxylase